MLFHRKKSSKVLKGIFFFFFFFWGGGGGRKIRTNEGKSIKQDCCMVDVTHTPGSLTYL